MTRMLSGDRGPLPTALLAEGTNRSDEVGGDVRILEANVMYAGGEADLGCGVEYFVYGRDGIGGYSIKVALKEEHWGFMDGYGEEMVARGPTLTDESDEAETTGSLHIVELPDVEAARRFAYDEPYYRAGAFESVLLCRFDNRSGRTMWDFVDAVEGYGRYLVLAMDEVEPAPVVESKQVIVYGELLGLEDEVRIGWAALVEAPDREAAAALLPVSGGRRTEVHLWRFGGRPS